MLNKKRILSGLLVLCMILAMCPIIPLSAGAVTVLPTITKDPQIAGLDGMDPEGTDITYLSDLHNQSSPLTLNDRVVGQTANSKVVLNQNYNGDLLAFDGTGGRKQIKASLNADGERILANGISYKPTDIALGYMGIKYAKGLGVHPNGVGATDRSITYNITGLGNRFYSVVGATGYEITRGDLTTRKVIFQLWASKDNVNFVELAEVGGIRAWNIGEFDIDITGYNYIKLVVKMDASSDSNTSCAVAWGGACVYNVPVPETEPPTELPSNPPRPTDPLNPSYFAGKKVSILGDSISTYTNVSNNAAYNSTIGVNKGFYSDSSYGGFTRKDTWWQQTIDLLGMELLVDNAWGGACILNARPEQDNVGANSVAYGDRCVNLHNDKTDEKPDVILVFKGTNDFSYFPSTLGSADLIDYTTLITKNVDGTYNYAIPSTTCEAYAIMLHKMQTAYPDAEIFCMTLMPRRGNQNQPTAFNASIKAIAERFGCGVVELGNLFSSEEAEFDKYIADQKVHPNKEGMDLMTQAVVNTMLNKETPVYDVNFNLKDGVMDNNAHVALGGSNYQIKLTPAIVNNGLKDVTVTMGGVDITAQVYSNGKVNIPNVTGDVVINATSAPLNGKHENATNIQYLSDLFNTNVVAQLNNKVVLDKEYSSNLYLFLEGKRWLIAGNAATDANGNRTFTLSDGSKVTFNKTDIALGYTAVKYNKGLGVHPNPGNAASRYIVYNVKDLGVDRFYAVVGATGPNPTNPATETHKITFELWGSTGETYNDSDMVLLESISNLRAHLTGEFNVDISGYNYIKLVVRMADGCVDNQQSSAAWADACVYSTKPAHEHTWDDGVVTKEATPFETGVKTYTCGCGATKEEVIEKATFTMTTNKPTYQIGLIEPWFMQINARVIQPGTSNTTIDYSKVLNYGAFAIREPQMSNPDDLSIENLMNEENVVHFTKEAGNISITSDTYLTFKFTEGLYTYRLNQDIVWVVYYQTADGWFATATREKNLYDLMDSRKDSTDPIYGEFEKDVYAKMVTLFEQITDYRSDFDEQKDGIPQNTATLGNTNIVFGADNSADGTVKFKRLQQIVLVEPWGIKLNTRIHWSTQTSSSDHIDYNAAEDFGLIVYHDKTGAATGMATYEDMLNFADKDNIHVFSKSQGNMEASGAYMGATMNKDIFTYEMDSTLYYMFFLKVDGKFYYNKVNATNIKDLAAERALITDGTYSEKERAVYTAMVDLCDSITAYREDYFAKNPDLA